MLNAASSESYASDGPYLPWPREPPKATSAVAQSSLDVNWSPSRKRSARFLASRILALPEGEPSPSPSPLEDALRNEFGGPDAPAPPLPWLAGTAADLDPGPSASEVDAGSGAGATLA